MKLLSTSKDLKSNLNRLIKTYPNISFGVAWASAATTSYQLLLENREKIRRGIVGTHFYQTHPDVLDNFSESQQVKFVLQSKGIFHPKVYLFWDNKKWEGIIGSANFTASALGVNTELCVMLNQNDGDHFAELSQLIEEYAAKARTITSEQAANYRSIWKTKQSQLHKIADQYGDKEVSKSAVDSRVMSLDWPSFFAEIKKDQNHDFKERLNLLTRFQQDFRGTAHFKNLDPQVRRAIAGIPNTEVEHSAWFGSMKGAGVFKNLIIAHPEQLSAALDEIPMDGTVTRTQYEAYTRIFESAFPSRGGGIATATRLLSMKRPDQFICVNKANLKSLADDIGRRNRSSMTYEQYWSEVVELTMDAPWWKSSPPSSGAARQAWALRSAMLDSIFYVPV